MPFLFPAHDVDAALGVDSGVAAGSGQCLVLQVYRHFTILSASAHLTGDTCVVSFSRRSHVHGSREKLPHHLGQRRSHLHGSENELLKT